MKLNLLKAKMMEQEKVQAEFEKLLGLGYGAVNKRFNGHTKFKPKEIAIIKDYLNLSNDEVVEIFLS